VNIVFAGTPNFAARHLEMLIDSDFRISCVLTQPDRVSGRGKKISLSPVKEMSLKKGFDLFQPMSLKNSDSVQKIKEIKPDLIVVVAYGLIIPKKILDIPTIGCINVHGSLLPKWRGASPMEYSIMNGDKKTGLSYMKMTEGLDEGPVYEMHECIIEPNDKLSDIEKKLIELSKKNLVPFLNRIKNRQAKSIEQDHDNFSLAPKIKKQDLQIDWVNTSSSELVKKVNALSEKYGVFTFLNNKRVKIHDVSETVSSESSKPGLIDLSDETLTVTCKNDTRIKINILQIEGRKKVTAKEFISAYKDVITKSKNFSYKTQ